MESASAQYKRALDALFDKGEAADFIKEKLAAAGIESEGPSERTELMRAVRKAKVGKELEQALDAFLAKYELPDDLELLLRCLEHPADKVLLLALDLIWKQVELGNPLPSKPLFVQRLKGIEIASFDPRVQRKAAKILAKIA